MKTWLRGKRGGLIAFAAITALVAGALAWVSAAVVRLEREQLEARAEADLHGKLRLALWRLDSFTIPELAREASRPFAHFSAIYAPFPTLTPAGKIRPAGDCLELSPLLNADLPHWMYLHFSSAGGKDWWSPQVLSESLRHRLGKIIDLPRVDNSARALLLQELAANVSPEQLLAQVRRHECSQRKTKLEPSDASLGPVNAMPWGAQNPAQQSVQEFQNRKEISSSNYGTNSLVAPKTQMNSSLNPTGNTYFGTLSPNDELLLSAAAMNSRQMETVVPGPMTAFWLTTVADRQRLIVARQVSVGGKQVCQGMVLNWEALCDTLTPLVDELFPEGRLRPMRLDDPEHPERTMTALPIELDPGPTDVPVAGWTPLRLGLALTWTAALVALLAAGLGGWSLFNLSERRIRFVSAVTHELRTPLTTLRLYLDMLTGGMVKDEKQKDEYLHTLNTETERLNRLVGNVLDFSRLENHKPRLEKAPVRAADLLEQLASTWSNRCKDAGKELIVDNRIDPALELHTDVNMVQQILGNLIDNACKYTHAAADPGIWLRASVDANRARFEVEDRGPGIPVGEGRSIFRPFRRGRDTDVTAGGVGLGLALARRWAQLLDGSLVLVPIQAGACFRVELPVRSNHCCPR
jgi:signal transduction histidine kinase